MTSCSKTRTLSDWLPILLHLTTKKRSTLFTRHKEPPAIIEHWKSHCVLKRESGLQKQDQLRRSGSLSACGVNVKGVRLQVFPVRPYEKNEGSAGQRQVNLSDRDQGSLNSPVESSSAEVLPSLTSCQLHLWKWVMISSLAQNADILVSEGQ